jgi:hypothetical protein
MPIIIYTTYITNIVKSGYGRGYGWRNVYYATGVHGLGRGGWSGWGYPNNYPVTGDEAGYLKQEAEYLEKALESIRARINELGKESDKKEG